MWSVQLSVTWGQFTQKKKLTYITKTVIPTYISPQWHIELAKFLWISSP